MLVSVWCERQISVRRSILGKSQASQFRLQADLPRLKMRAVIGLPSHLKRRAQQTLPSMRTTTSQSRQSRWTPRNSTLKRRMTPQTERMTSTLLSGSVTAQSMTTSASRQFTLKVRWVTILLSRFTLTAQARRTISF